MHLSPLLFAVVLLLCACHPASSTDPLGPSGMSSPAPDDAGRPSAGDSAAAYAPDPFAAQPDTSEGLTNVSTDLRAILEQGQLEGACDRYREQPDDRRLMLLCGKYLFFYGGFDQEGPPRVLLTTLLETFPDLTGPGFANYGMIEDPYSPDGLPIGFGPSAPAAPGIPTVSYTCASCHLAKLPDGRFSVGAPNHAFAYGKQLVLMLSFFRLLAGDAESDHHPDAVAIAKPYLDRVWSNPFLLATILGNLIGLVELIDTAPTLTAAQEGWHANWREGTLDAVMPPLYLDDGVHIPLKMQALWGIPDLQEAREAGAENVMIGWHGTVVDMQSFLTAFLQLGGAPLDKWTPEAMRPLEAYVQSLQAPDNPTRAPAQQLARGRELFEDAGCIDCHGGPRGMGTELYALEEIGTDPALKYFMDDDLDGEYCCGYAPANEAPSHAVKAPRLVGLWTMSRFLHNGSVDSLDALLCLEPRRGVSGDGAGDHGHEYGCDLPREDRRALVDFMLAL